MGEKGSHKKTAEDFKKTRSWRKPVVSDDIEMEMPQSGRGKEDPPDWLTEEEVEIWRDFLPKALEMKTYGNADHFSFALFCRAACDLRRIGGLLFTFRDQRRMGPF